MPVMSAGIMSGVNWMRLKLQPSTWATVFTSNVLASPGTPITKVCPCEKTAARMARTVSF